MSNLVSQYNFKKEYTWKFHILQKQAQDPYQGP